MGVINMTNVKYIELSNELKQLKNVISKIEMGIESNHDLNVVAELKNLNKKSDDVINEAKVIFKSLNNI